jgi:hypothetical protein
VRFLVFRMLMVIIFLTAVEGFGKRQCCFGFAYAGF